MTETILAILNLGIGFLLGMFVMWQIMIRRN